MFASLASSTAALLLCLSTGSSLVQSAPATIPVPRGNNTLCSGSCAAPPISGTLNPYFFITSNLNNANPASSFALVASGNAVQMAYINTADGSTATNNAQWRTYANSQLQNAATGLCLYASNFNNNCGAALTLVNCDTIANPTSWTGPIAPSPSGTMVSSLYGSCAHIQKNSQSAGAAVLTCDVSSTQLYCGNYANELWTWVNVPN